jgi:hypothetical protein
LPILLRGLGTLSYRWQEDHMDDYLRLQLQQAIETYRWQYSLMVQIVTLLLMADAAVIWYAFTGNHWRLWGIWFLGACLAGVAILVLLATAPLMKPVMYTAVSIEQTQRHCADQTPPAACAPYDGLASMLISTTYWRQNYIESLEHAAEAKDLNTRRVALRKLSSPYDFWTLIWKTSTGRTLLLLSVAQVLAAFFVGPGTFIWRRLWKALVVIFVLEVLVTLPSAAGWPRT